VETEDKPEKSNENHLENLKNFLDKQFKSQQEEVKPQMLTAYEMESFFNIKITPAYKQLKQQLSEYAFDTVGYNVRTRVATLKISDTFTVFSFKTDINNNSREITFFFDLKYRDKRKKKLFVIRSSKNKKVLFKDIETINPDLVLSLFAEWFMGKDELIQKDRAWREAHPQDEN